MPQELAPASPGSRVSGGPGAPALAPLASRTLLGFWIAYVVLSAVDCVTTVFALEHHLAESNPFAARLYAQWGMPALWGLKFAVLALMLPLLARLPRRVAVGVAGVLVAVMWLNDLSNLSWIIRAG